MTANKKRLAAIIKELYLYPYRTKADNLIRGIVWMASWLIGIVPQQEADIHTLGGAYFMFSISLLLEFIPEKRSQFISKIVHGIFCALLLAIFLLSLVLVFDARLQQADLPCINRIAFVIGWIIFTVMIVEVVLALFDAHEFLYNEEAEQERIKNEEDQKTINIFMDSVKKMEGGQKK